MNDNTPKKISRIVIILSAVIAVLSVYILLTNDLADKPLAGQGGSINASVSIGGDFELVDHNGHIFNSEQMKGRLSLIYFGFTFCPDICPTSLQKLSDVISTLDKYNIDVLPIFITLDPARDTPDLLKEYLGHFHPKFIGLTGSEEGIKNVTELYKVYYAVADNSEQENGKYMLDHSSFVYLMDAKGKYLKHFYLSTTAEEIIEYIRLNAK